VIEVCLPSVLISVHRRSYSQLPLPQSTGAVWRWSV
jgi:hypothetical protein